MKFIKLNNEGFTLIEVIISIMLISIVLIGFISGFSNNFINIVRGKTITVNTFNLQELLEDQIASFIEEDLEIDSPLVKDIKVYNKTIKYKKLEAILPNTSRNLVMYISKPKIGMHKSPEIVGLQVNAFNQSGIETFPWYEDGTRLEVSYDVSDPLIFQKNFAWYVSKDVSGIPLKNPEFTTDYNKYKFKNGVYKGTMPNLSKQMLHNELKPNRFYHYGIIPYSEAGKLGKLAMNENRLLVIKKTSNAYWNNLIQEAYLNNLNTNLEPLVLTMNNVDKLTLNVESDSSNMKNGALVFVPIKADYKNKTSSFKTVVEMEFDSKTSDSSKGFGLFIGNYNDGNENGIIFLVDQIESEVYVKRITNGTVSEVPIQTFSVQTPLELEKRYTWSFEISRPNNNHNISVLYKPTTNQYFQTIAANKALSLDFITTDIGLKTWSSYSIKDEFNEEHKYTYNLTAHFYDIDIKK